MEQSALSHFASRSSALERGLGQPSAAASLSEPVATGAHDKEEQIIDAAVVSSVELSDPAREVKKVLLARLTRLLTSLASASSAGCQTSCSSKRA